MELKSILVINLLLWGLIFGVALPRALDHASTTGTHRTNFLP